MKIAVHQVLFLGSLFKVADTGKVRSKCFSLAIRLIGIRKVEFDLMADFTCRLGTPSGEVVTRIVEALGASDARVQLEREGYRVFSVTSTSGGLTSALPFGGTSKKKVKQSDFLLFLD